MVLKICRYVSNRPIHTGILRDRFRYTPIYRTIKKSHMYRQYSVKYRRYTPIRIDAHSPLKGRGGVWSFGENVCGKKGKGGQLGDG